MCLNSPRHSEVQWRFCLQFIFSAHLFSFSFSSEGWCDPRIWPKGSFFVCFVWKYLYLGLWLFLILWISWQEDEEQEEEEDVCGFNLCLSVTVSVYQDKCALIWHLTLLHIGILECVLYGDVFRFVSLSFRIRSGLCPFGFITLSIAFAKCYLILHLCPLWFRKACMFEERRN